MFLAKIRYAKGGNKQVLRKQSNRRPNIFSTVETATINELIVETHRLTKFPLCIHQDNTMGCYDRIIRKYVFLNSRKFGIRDNFCKFYSIAHDLMKFRTEINNTISKTN